MSRSAATFAALAVLGAALLGQLGGEPSRAAQRPPVAAGDLVIDTVVGTGDPVNAGDGGPAHEAGLTEPVDVATGPDGTLYVLAGLQIRAVDPKTNTITTIAGTGEAGFSGDGGPATKATFADARNALYGVRGIDVGDDGTVYVADAGNHRIRAIDPETGTIRTVAGSGATGEKDKSFGGDGGKATKALLYYPRDVAVDADGNLYISDYLNYRVRMVSAETGKIRTIAGIAHPGDGGSGFFPEPDAESDKATKTFVEPNGIAVHPSGTVYFSEQDDDRVRAVDPAKNTIETVAGTGTNASEVSSPTGLAFSPDGDHLYIAGTDPFAADTTENRIYRFDLDTERARVYAGGAEAGGLGDGGRPTDAFIGGPVSSGSIGVATGSDGAIYLTDARHYRVRMVAEATRDIRPDHRLAGEPIDTLLGTGKRVSAEDFGDDEDGPFYRDVHALDDVDLHSPSDIVVGDDGTLYVADTGNNRIRTVDPGEGIVRTLAGRPDTPDYGETDLGDGGEATKAYLSSPRSLALSPDGKLYFADDTGDEATIRFVDLDDGTVDTLEGSRYEFTSPSGMAFDDNGDLYVVDAATDRICRLRPSADECVTVVADDPDEHGTETDRLQSATGLAVGPDGGLYVASSYQILRVDKRTGKISTFAGYLSGAPGMSGDGASAYSAQLGVVTDLTLADGTLYLTDQMSHRVRAIDMDSHVIRRVAGAGRYEARTDPNDTATYGGGGFRGDGKAAARAELDEPTAVAAGPDGELYVVDGGNQRVRVIGDTQIRPGIVVHPLVLVAVGAALLLATPVVLRVRRRRTSIAS